MTKKNKPDLCVLNCGSVFMFEPVTKRAARWVDENVHLESWQWHGSAFCVDHRFAVDLALGMVDAGLVVE